MNDASTKNSGERNENTFMNFNNKMNENLITNIVQYVHISCVVEVQCVCMFVWECGWLCAPSIQVWYLDVLPIYYIQRYTNSLREFNNENKIRQSKNIREFNIHIHVCVPVHTIYLSIERIFNFVCLQRNNLYRHFFYCRFNKTFINYYLLRNVLNTFHIFTMAFLIKRHWKIVPKVYSIFSHYGQSTSHTFLNKTFFKIVKSVLAFFYLQRSVY